MRRTLEEVRAALVGPLKKHWGTQTAFWVGGIEVMALVALNGETYKGKLVVSWGEKAPWDGKKLNLIGAKRLVSVEGKKCGYCQIKGDKHSVASCKALGENGLALVSLVDS